MFGRKKKKIDPLDALFKEEGAAVKTKQSDFRRKRGPVWRWWQRVQNAPLGSEKSILLENLGLLLEAGMDVLDSFGSIRNAVRTGRMKKIIDKVAGAVDEGSGIWEALDHYQLFPRHIISLIRIGEIAGQLPQNLDVIGIQQQKDRDFKSKIRSAMMYPVLVLGVAFVVGIGIAIFILPRLASIFSGMRIELPVLTRWMIAAGKFLGQYGDVAVLAFVAGFLLIIYLLFFLKYTRIAGQFILYRLPGIKQLIMQVELSRMGYILGNLLRAGVPVIDAVSSLEEAAQFYGYKRLYGNLKERLSLGDSFGKVFKSYKKTNRYIPSPIQQMIAAGEQSGKLSETLLKIGGIYESKTEVTSKNITVILEPLLLVMVWGVVVVVALAVIMPIYGLIGNLNTSISNSRTDQQPDQSRLEEIQEIPTPGPTLLRVIDTPTGELNVRALPEPGAEIVAKAKVGEEYVYTEEAGAGETSDWYKITVEMEGAPVTGWVTAEYVSLLE